MEEYISGEKHREMIGKEGSRLSKNNKSKKYIGPVIVVILLCIASFYGGAVYEKGLKPKTTVTTASSGAFAFGPGGATGHFSGRRGGLGTVTAVSPSSITITSTATNSSLTYSITSTTAITDGSTGQAIQTSAINVGDTVLVRASSTSSTQAATIIDNPSFGGGAPSSSGGSSGPTTIYTQ